MQTLHTYLKTNGITQSEFAERIRTTQANISKLCGDEPKLSPDMAVRIEQETKGAVTVESWPQFAVLVSRFGSHGREAVPVQPHQSKSGAA